MNYLLPRQRRRSVGQCVDKQNPDGSAGSATSRGRRMSRSYSNWLARLQRPRQPFFQFQQVMLVDGCGPGATHEICLGFA
jgi:hypothetical protein